MARDAEGRRVAALKTGQLPVRLTPLVGRQRELHEVVDALSRSRLVSLTGPGGTGKTRLALAAADAARARFPAGVCWVELAPIGDPAIAARAVADALGVPEVPGQDATAAIAEHVGERPMLIVLDTWRRRWRTWWTACSGPVPPCPSSPPAASCSAWTAS
jgi:non-specific serine/threonine protein kinase